MDGSLTEIVCCKFAVRSGCHFLLLTMFLDPTASLRLATLRNNLRGFRQTKWFVLNLMLECQFFQVLKKVFYQFLALFVEY